MMIKSENGKLIKLTKNEVMELQDIEYRDNKKRLSSQWLRDRQAAYAQLNQDEMRYDDLINGTTIWQDTITAIKAKYPKPL